MLDYKLLEALDMVQRCGSFEAAARKLHLTPSAVSQRIRQLEERHGSVLLRRETPMQPTATGEALLAHVRQVRQLEGELVARMDSSSPATALRIGVNADSLAVGLLEAITPLLMHERILLDAVVDDEAYTLDLLRSGDVIGCISTQTLQIAGCEQLHLGCMRYVGVAAPQFAERYFASGVSASGLQQAPAAVYGYKDSVHRRLLREHWGLQEGTYPCHVIPDSHALYAAACTGLAYAVVPAAQAVDELQSGRLLALPQLDVSLPLYWHYWAITSRHSALLGEEVSRFVQSLDVSHD